MSGHTPGKMGWIKRTVDGSLIYIIGDHNSGPHAQGDIHIGEEDMSRIALCWNACDGLDSVVLAMWGMQGRSIKNELRDAQASVEELRNACKSFRLTIILWRFA